MKILLVSDYGAPTGGAEIAILGLRETLRWRGHDARLFSSTARHVAVPVEADYACFGATSRLQTLIMAANPSAFFQLRRVLDSFQPDVIHVKMFLWQLSPLILPLIKSMPSIYHVSTYKPVCPIGTKVLPDQSECSVRAGAVCYQKHCLSFEAWLPMMFELKLWRRWRNVFDLFVAPSQAVQSRLVAEEIEPVQVIPYGVPLRPARPPLSTPPTIAFAGRLVSVKGVGVLVRAFQQVLSEIPDARLVIMGEGEERANIERLVEELGLSAKITMLGHLPRRQMEAYFDKAWVQVVPSRWAEPFGIVAIEAMMRGTAVIASDVGGLREIVVEGKTGRLVTPGDAGALARALLAMLRDRDQAETLGRAGRRVALERFSEEIFVDRMMGIYRTLVGGITKRG